MAQLNLARKEHRVTHEGGRARAGTPEQQLKRAVTACMLWEKTFYEDGVSIALRIHDLASRCSPRFVADLAIETRKKHGIRHASLWLALSLIGRGMQGTDKVISKVISRADELGEIIAMQWTETKQSKVSGISAFGIIPNAVDHTEETSNREGKLPNALKRGVALAFPKFDPYQLAKYNRKDRAVTLRDAMRMCHPKPANEEMAKVYKDLKEGTLASPDTWEVRLSGGEDKKEVFTDLLKRGRLGYLATLRNIRKMREVGVDQRLIIDRLLSEKGRRGILPFQFISAAITNPDFEQHIEAPMLACLEDMPSLEGDTAVIVDTSGSMGDLLSAKSVLQLADAACGMAIMVRELCRNVQVYAFSTDVKMVPSRRGFALRDAIRATNVGWETYGDRAVEHALMKNPNLQRIIMITDMQLHDNLQAYPSVPHKYVVNVAPYQNGVGYGNWNWIDGFSEQTIRYMQEYEALGTAVRPNHG